MNIKTVLIFTATATILVALVLFLMPRETQDIQLDIRKVNHIVKTLSDGWGELRNRGDILPYEDEIDYVVITSEGKLVAATRDGLNEHINDAIRNRDTIVDISVEGRIVGKAIFYNDTARIIDKNRQSLIFTSVIILIILILIFTGYALYLYSVLLRPFKKMQDLARHIAAGNLDIPLKMDRNNLFGAFTESLDIMRDELHRARENECEANRSKKELVASISHDIKTPVASIKSAAELMLLTTDNEEYKEQLEGINVKAEQINTLVTNMFHSVLEELQMLSISVTEIQSAALTNLIRYADYEKRVKSFELPNCLIFADTQRVQQVFDNIISNAYKYAGTDIDVHAFFEGKYFAIDIIDYGTGVQENELPLLTNKFYRGKDATIKNGYGLGLYISKNLMEQMSGNLRCENRPDGFCVRLMFRMAG